MLRLQTTLKKNKEEGNPPQLTHGLSKAEIPRSKHLIYLCAREIRGYVLIKKPK